MTRVYLIRHGETVWNADGRIQGHLDTALSDLGIRQAAATAERLRAQPITAVWSSDLERAWRTAEAVAAPHHRKVDTTPLLREVHLGEWQGLTRAEARELHPSPAAGLFANRPPGGETFDALQTRAVQALGDLLAAHPDGTIAVVTHGGPIKALLCWALDAPTRSIPRFQIDNASISVLRFDGERRQIEAVNDTAHLMALGGAMAASGADA